MRACKSPRTCAGAEGLSSEQSQQAAVLDSAHLPVVEAQGEVGDVLLCDGFLVHSQSLNTGTTARIITNNAIHLHQPMNFARPNANDYSVRERSLLRAINSSAALS